MARRLVSRHLHQYLFTPPRKVDESLWRQDVEQMALIEEARRVENRMPQLRREAARTHVLQWGRETEAALRAQLWVMIRTLEYEARYAQVMRHMRRLRGL